MEDERWLWLNEDYSGPYSIENLHRMAEEEEIGPETAFWSDRRQEWMPLRGLMFDLYPSRLEEMRETGIQAVEIVGSGTGEECHACDALDGTVHPIAEAPDLPPTDCTCIPWCRSIYIAK